MKRKKITSKKINPYQKILTNMEKKISKSYKKLTENMLKNAPFNTLKKDTHELMMLLGETNYLAKECKKMNKKSKE